MIAAEPGARCPWGCRDFQPTMVLSLQSSGHVPGELTQCPAFGVDLLPERSVSEGSLDLQADAAFPRPLFDKLGDRFVHEESLQHGDGEINDSSGYRVP